MKKQINPTIKAHLIRGAFYLRFFLWAQFHLRWRNEIPTSESQLNKSR